MAIILDGINGRVSAGHGGVHHEYRYRWPARLCSASISPAATQVPPFSHNMQKKSLSHEYQRHSACFIPLWRALHRTETRVNIHRLSGDRSDAQSVIHPLCALCLPQTHSRFLSRWIHLQRRMRGQGGCSDWNPTQTGGIKSLLTAEKSRLIHRSLQEDFRWQESSLFRRLFLCACMVFFLLWGENSCGKPVPVDPGAPVAAVRTDDDDGDEVRSQEQRTQLPVGLIKIKHYIRPRGREVEIQNTIWALYWLRYGKRTCQVASIYDLWSDTSRFALWYV